MNLKCFSLKVYKGIFNEIAVWPIKQSIKSIPDLSFTAEYVSSAWFIVSEEGHIIPNEVNALLTLSIDFWFSQPYNNSK